LLFVWKKRLTDCTREEFNGLFRKALEEILAQCREYGGPCICDEFGFERDTTKDAVIYTRMKDTIKLLDEYDLSWVIRTYKDMGDMGLTYLE
jgi:hypothetical protein